VRLQRQSLYTLLIIIRNYGEKLTDKDLARLVGWQL
jgi:hypothetical protein